jgi:hypothetical protein
MKRLGSGELRVDIRHNSKQVPCFGGEESTLMKKKKKKKIDGYGLLLAILCFFRHDVAYVSLGGGGGL